MNTNDQNGSADNGPRHPAAHARWYLQQGYLPIPLPPRKKSPCRRDWQKLRPTPETLPQLFPDDYRGNIGLITGAPTGLVDVDLDCAEALTVAPYFLPKTAMIHGRASAPASHHWYHVSGTAPPYAAYEDTKGDKLVELRSTGHQTMVPPSVHPEGERLRWEGRGASARVAGETLQEAVRAIAAASLLARHWPSQGSRQDTALALAGGLLRAGWSVADTGRMLRAVTAAAGDEEATQRLSVLEPTAQKLRAGEPVSGWPVLARLLGPPGEGVVQRVRSWLGCPSAATPATWEEPIPFQEYPVPEFPLVCLPEALGGFVESVSAALQTPADLAALLGLAVCGAALAKGCRVRVREGWEEPLNLYCVVALAPGERKSSVFELLLAPVREYEAWLQECQGPEIAARTSEHRVLENRLKALEAKAARCDNPRERPAAQQEAQQAALELEAHQVPALPQLLCDDVTPEMLASLLGRQGGRLLQASTEGTAFEIVKGRYATGANCEIYLKAHCGDDLRVHRIHRGADVVVQPALTVALAVQPDVIHGLAAQASLAGRGFLARWFYALPRSRVGSRTIAAPPVSEEQRAAYRELVLDLWRLGRPAEAERDAPPVILHLGPEAERLLREFEAWLEPRLGPEGELSSLAGWANKLAGAVARLAGILHAVRAVRGEVGIDQPIPQSTAIAAVQLGRDYLLPHARAAFGLMAADPRVGLARTLLGWLSRAVDGRGQPLGRISRREAWKRLNHRLARAEEIDPILDLLVRHQYLAPLAAPPREGGGRPVSQQYEVNPRLVVVPASNRQDDAPAA
jgi:hypothetical protein